MGFRFSGEQKLGLFFIMYIYTTFILSILLVKYWGVFSFLLGFSSFPIMQITTFTYRLYMYKKSREELEGYKYFMGWLITSEGNWHNVDIGIDDYEEIDTTDQEMNDFEKRMEFSKAIEEVKKENPELQEKIEEDVENDQFIETELSKDYKEFGLVTSRQIYCFELIRKFEKNKVKLQPIIDKLKEISSDNIGEKTSFLESKMIELNITEDEIKKLINNEVGYYDKTVQLENISEVRKNPEDIKSIVTPFMRFILVCIILVILNVFVGIFNNYILTDLKSISDTTALDDIENIVIKTTTVSTYITVISLVLIVAIVVFAILSIRVANKFKSTSTEPYKIVFQNKINSTLSVNALCYLRTKIAEFPSDALIYKVTPLQDPKELDPKKTVHGRIWASDTVYMILPQKWGETFEFKTGYIGHKGQVVGVPSASLVMIEVGRIFKEPMYLVIGSNYHYKRLTRVYHNYNMLQNWKNKAYQYVISELESKLAMTKPELQSANIRSTKWKKFAIGQAQLFLKDEIERHQELRKGGYSQVPNVGDEEEGQPSPEQIQQYKQMMMMQEREKKKRMIKILFLVTILGIAFIAILYLVFSGNTTSAGV